MKKGYTLIELVVAITIIALLFTAGVVSYTKANERSRDARRMSDLEQVRSALEMYRADNGSYPIQSCTAPCNINVSDLTDIATYISEFPVDPNGSEYRYRPGNWTSGKAYTYCLYAKLETTTAPDLSGCAASGSFNYAVKNP